jgi:hypothetical protein
MSLVTLPNELKIVIGTLVMYLVTEGLKVVSGWFGKDLSGWGAGLAAALTGLVVVFAENLLTLVPAEYEQIAQAVLSALVVLLGGFGLHRFAKRVGSTY